MREYVGARYVPNFVDDDYDPTQSYQAMDVVSNGMGTSYIAKKPVPAGIPQTNREYWFLYGVTNGAIINLQNQIDDINDSIKEAYLTPQMFGAVGDGLTDDSDAFNDMLDSGFKLFYIPSGSYLIKNSLYLHKVSFIGAGSAITELLFYNCDGLSVNRDTMIEGVSITNANSDRTHTAINMYNPDATELPHVNINDVRVYYFQYGIRSVDASVWSSSFKNIRLGANSYAIYIDGTGNDSSAFCNIFENVMVDSRLDKTLYIKNAACTFIGCNFGVTSLLAVETNLAIVDFINCSFEMDKADETVINGSIINISGNIRFESCRFLDYFRASGTNYFIKSDHEAEENRFTFINCSKLSYAGSYLTKLFNPSFMANSPTYGSVLSMKNNFSIYDDVYNHLKCFIQEDYKPLLLIESTVSLTKLKLGVMYMYRYSSGGHDYYEPAIYDGTNLVNMYDHSIIYVTP